MSDRIKLAVCVVGLFLVVGLVVLMLLGWIDKTRGTVAFIFIGTSLTIMAATITGIWDEGPSS